MNDPEGFIMPPSHQSFAGPVPISAASEPGADIKREISPSSQTVAEKPILKAEDTHCLRKGRAVFQEPVPEMEETGAETDVGVKYPMVRNKEGLQLIRTHCIMAQAMKLHPEIMIRGRSGEPTSITLPDVDYSDPVTRQGILRQFEYLTTVFSQKSIMPRDRRQARLLSKRRKTQGQTGKGALSTSLRLTLNPPVAGPELRMRARMLADHHRGPEPAVSAGTTKAVLQNSIVHGQRPNIFKRGLPTREEERMLLKLYVELFLDHFQKFEAMTDCMREVNDTFRPATLADKQYTSIEDLLKGYKKNTRVLESLPS